MHYKLDLINQIAAIIQSTPSGVTPTLIIAGQSGARGKPEGTGPPEQYKQPNPNAQITGSAQSSIFVPTFEVMDFDTGNFLGNPFGIEASVAFNYAPSKLRIVKVSHGSTNLAVNWASGSVLRNLLIDSINYAKGEIECK